MPAQQSTMDKADRAQAADMTDVKSFVIFEVIRRQGDHELSRPFSALWWSSVTAGLAISTSVLAEGFLVAALPHAPWATLVSSLGYTVGFLVVILGRMQLFTENTITTVLPVVARRTMSCLMSMLRLWGIVLAANVVGALVAAAFLAIPDVVSPEVSAAIAELSHHAVGMGAGQSFLRAIPAGVLVAAIVWMMPSTAGNAFFVILTFTWLIAAGDFTHIIAGSVEMGYLLWHGELGLGAAAGGFFLPVLAGNIVGGTAIFTLLAWGQVRNEVDPRTGEATGG
jgi:formate/nitrite transporter FocA (FNT family)